MASSRSKLRAAVRTLIRKRESGSASGFGAAFVGSVDSKGSEKSRTRDRPFYRKT
jgi:hypothetical protein